MPASISRPIQNARFVIYSSSTFITPAQIQTMVIAMNQELSRLATAYGRVAIPILYVSGTPPSVANSAANSWPVYIMDQPDIAGAYGYHDIQSGVPYAKIFTNPIKSSRGTPLYNGPSGLTVASVVFHEIVEMFGDYFADGWAQDARGLFWAYELADAVQSNIITVPVINNSVVTNVGLSDYVLPAWFNPQDTVGPFSRNGTVKAPFRVDKGGYAIVFNGSSYSYVLGSAATAETKAKAEKEVAAMILPAVGGA